MSKRIFILLHSNLTAEVSKEIKEENLNCAQSDNYTYLSEQQDVCPQHHYVLWFDTQVHNLNYRFRAQISCLAYNVRPEKVN